MACFAMLTTLLAAKRGSHFPERFEDRIHSKEWLQSLGFPRPAFGHMSDCALAEARSQQWLDLMMLGPLHCMKQARPGTFVELGAFTGVNLSNTVMLERCYNWTGLLIEGSPGNFAKLLESGRRAPMVHTAICPGEKDSFVDFTAVGGEICTVADPTMAGAALQKASTGPSQLARPAHKGGS